MTAVYTIQLLTLNGEQFIVPRLIDTLIGCLIAFGGMVWLWPQWQSGLLRKNAHDALEADQEAIRLILSNDPQATPLAYQRMRVNQAHNTLFNSLNQAMQEPGFNTHYLSDMKLWVTHSQFIVEHINAMTTLAREHTMLTPDLAQRYLESWRDCDSALPAAPGVRQARRLRRCQYSGVAGHAVTWLIEHSGTTFTAHHWPS
ncbi:integral membrane protein, YccS/YhfK family [Salmonella enterica subsp. enterica]|uniref:Integral membrane protein, YccS/YhfK family n=1 Tax=Salmonella enterica I TaxID=59201 RepID=A0A447PW23_SALET|nr:integral membrane protein, YccS/YhfK family [Salmonella enterica subsp. enterica]